MVPAHYPGRPAEHYDTRLAALAGEFLPGFRDLDMLLDAHHPLGLHWHLAFLAVEPERQGQRLGTALLDHTLIWLDRHQVPAYLEATNTANARLYSRFGFRDHGDPIQLGPGTFYPMWRPIPAVAPVTTPAVKLGA